MVLLVGFSRLNGLIGARKLLDPFFDSVVILHLVRCEPCDRHRYSSVVPVVGHRATHGMVVLWTKSLVYYVERLWIESPVAVAEMEQQEQHLMPLCCILANDAESVLTFLTTLLSLAKVSTSTSLKVRNIYNLIYPPTHSLTIINRSLAFIIYPPAHVLDFLILHDR